MLNSSVSVTLQMIARRSNKSLYAIAQESGLSQSTVTRWYNGESNISLETAELIADVLGNDLILLERKPKHAYSRSGSKRQ